MTDSPRFSETARLRDRLGQLAFSVVMVFGCSSSSTPHDDAPIADATSAIDSLGADALVPDAAAGRKRVFVSGFPPTQGDLKTAGAGADGLAGGDNLCAAAATRGALGGTWTAWLSTTAVNAIDRVADVGPWYRIDQTTLVFPTKAALLSPPLVPINVDETGAMASGLGGVWTGTLANGTVSAGNTCLDWTSASGVGTNNAQLGSWLVTTAGWTESGLRSCATMYKIYCFER